MTISKLVYSSQRELAELTGIDSFQWSRFDNGSLTSERTINKIAKALKLQPHEVLMGINLRRQKRREEYLGELIPRANSAIYQL